MNQESKNNFYKIIHEMFTWKTFWEIFRYGIITLMSYFFMVFCIWALKNYLDLGEKVSYAIALTINYIGVYVGYNKFVWKTAHSIGVVKRFSVVLICSWIANNIFFALWIDVFGIVYPIAVALNTVVLGAFRFMAQKFYVRK